MTELEQAGIQYRGMSAKERARLEENIAAELLFEKEEIRITVLSLLKKADETLEKSLKKRLRF